MAQSFISRAWGEWRTGARARRDCRILGEVFCFSGLSFAKKEVNIFSRSYIDAPGQSFGGLPAPPGDPAGTTERSYQIGDDVYRDGAIRPALD